MFVDSRYSLSLNADFGSISSSISTSSSRNYTKKDLVESWFIFDIGFSNWVHTDLLDGHWDLVVAFFLLFGKQLNHWWHDMSRSFVLLISSFIIHRHSQMCKEFENYVARLECRRVELVESNNWHHISSILTSSADVVCISMATITHNTRTASIIIHLEFKTESYKIKVHG